MVERLMKFDMKNEKRRGRHRGRGREGRGIGKMK